MENIEQNQKDDLDITVYHIKGLSGALKKLSFSLMEDGKGLDDEYEESGDCRMECRSVGILKDGPRRMICLPFRRPLLARPRRFVARKEAYPKPMITVKDGGTHPRVMAGLSPFGFLLPP